jgi:hypothetical protein
MPTTGETFYVLRFEWPTKRWLVSTITIWKISCCLLES